MLFYRNHQYTKIVLESMAVANTKKRSPWLKRLLIAGLLLLVAAAGIFWYVQTRKYGDTKDIKADYEVNATEFIAEFQNDLEKANQKYSDKIITVTGMVSETELADTSMNIKFIDMTTGSYAIFAFQKQYLDEAKTVRAGDNVSIKGSCSGGVFSRLRKVTSITFQRCTLDK